MAEENELLGIEGKEPVVESTEGNDSQAAGSETTTGEGGKDEVKPSKGLEPWVERRFAQLSAEKHSERREKDRLTEENANLKTQITRLFSKEQPKEGETHEAAAPSPQDLDKLVDQRASEKLAVSEFNRACNDINTKGEAEFKEDFEDARATLNSVYGDAIRQKPEFLQAIIAVPDGHKIFHFLGKNPQETERVLNMAPIPMAMEIAKIASSLSKPVDRQISNAPPPIRGKVDGTAKAPDFDPDDPDQPIEKWMEWREKDLEHRGARR